MDLEQNVLVALLIFSFCLPGSCNLVFDVHHKFKNRAKSLTEMRAHDFRRHGRLLSVFDIEIGGSARPSETGLYYAKIGLGSPSKDYYVQVDTGSDIFWVNCIGCTDCPKKSDIGVLTEYDPKSSSTSNLVTCNQPFCSVLYDAPVHGCKPDLPCQYKMVYGDGSSTAGYFVKDYIRLDQAVGNFKTATTNGTVIFGCGAKQSGQLSSSSAAVDGIIGFGQGNSSVISQLASTGKVKKMFAHCLDSDIGGGIFAIGEVVQPKVRTTPIVPHQVHYNVVLKGIEVGGDLLDVQSDKSSTSFQRGTIIDSGTTLAYLPESIYLSLFNKIFAMHPELKLRTVEGQFTCFQFTGDVDAVFPEVILYFEDDVDLLVLPHEYIFQIRSDVGCMGWQNSGDQSKDGKDVTILGDMVLQNKLVIYDLENQTIGWTDYDCSSSIKVKDKDTGRVYEVEAHDLSAAPALVIGRILTFLLPVIALTLSFIH